MNYCDKMMGFNCRHLANTFFDPIYARFAFPCFDEPDMKATFTITLENEPMYHALANTPQVGDDEVLSDGWIRATFEETVKMPTYLVCYVISDFKAKFTTTANGVKVSERPCQNFLVSQLHLWVLQFFLPPEKLNTFDLRLCSAVIHVHGSM